jgi:hypothetical protein
MSGSSGMWVSSYSSEDNVVLLPVAWKLRNSTHWLLDCLCNGNKQVFYSWLQLVTPCCCCSFLFFNVSVHGLDERADLMAQGCPSPHLSVFPTSSTIRQRTRRNLDCVRCFSLLQTIRESTTLTQLPLAELSTVSHLCICRYMPITC